MDTHRTLKVFIPAIAIGLLATVAGLGVGAATAADPVDPRLAQAQANKAAYCTQLVDDATTTRQNNTRADLCTMWTREVADLTPATPTPTATVNPTPTQTPSSSPTATPTVKPTLNPTTTPPATTPPASGWPNAANTGVPAFVSLTAWTGSCTISTAQTITARSFSCDLTINAAVTIANSRIAGAVEIGTNGRLTMTDSEVDASPGLPRQYTGVEDHDYTLTRVEIKGGNRGAYCEWNCTIRDSWVHGQELAEEWHASAVRMGQYSTFIHNTLACDAPQGPGEQSCSADLTGYGDFTPITDNLIENNYFVASADNAYCVYGGSSKGKPYSDQAARIVFKDNVFEKGSTGHCAWWGAVGDWDGSRPGNQWVNNKYTDGSPVVP